MNRKLAYLGLLALALTLAVAAACGGEKKKEVAVQPTAVAPAVVAIAPTVAPAVVKVAPTVAPAVVKVAPIVAPATSKFKGTFLYDGAIPTTFSESPKLAELVRAGKLPPVKDRLPIASDVMVVPVVDRIGDYGGTWRRAFTGPNDGQNADRLMMDQVLYVDLDGTNIIPNVAKGWKVSDDGLTYTLFLRQGMKWSDGTPFTAEDFEWYNKNVINNLEMNPTRKGQIGHSGFYPTSITAIDKYTVAIVLPKRGDGFLDKLATYFTGGMTQHGRGVSGLYGPTHYLKTIHRDFVADKAALDARVKAAGFDNWNLFFRDKSDPKRNTDLPVISPWKMTRPITGDLYVWERNPYYWAVDPAGNQLPYIDTVSMVLTGDQQVLNLKAAAGEIDFQHRHMLMDKVPVFRQNADKSNIEVLFWSSHGCQAGLVPNLSYGEGTFADGKKPYEPDLEVKKWLQSKDFRIALSQAIDRNKINEIMFLGLGNPKQPTFIKGHPFYPGEEYEKKYTKFDPALANKILDGLGLDKKDSSGFRLRTDGKGPLEFELMYIAQYFLDYETLAELIQEDLKKVGIKIFLKAQDVSVIAERRLNNDTVMMVDDCRGQRDALNIYDFHGVAPAWRAWWTGGTDVYSGGGVAAKPTDPVILRLIKLADESALLGYPDRKENYLEVQKLVIDNMLIIGLVGDTPAFNGVLVKKKNFKNVPLLAPNQSALQNPGIARTVQFFFEGGKNDSEK